MWKIVFRPDGTLWTLHHDQVTPLLQQLGSVQIRRKSEVEWDDTDQGWVVLNVTKTHRLLPHAYPTRKEAIDAEVAYWFGHAGLGVA